MNIFHILMQSSLGPITVFKKKLYLKECTFWCFIILIQLESAIISVLDENVCSYWFLFLNKWFCNILHIMTVRNVFDFLFIMDIIKVSCFIFWIFLDVFWRWIIIAHGEYELEASLNQLLTLTEHKLNHFFQIFTLISHLVLEALQGLVLVFTELQGAFIWQHFY